MRTREKEIKCFQKTFIGFLTTSQAATTACEVENPTPRPDAKRDVLLAADAMKLWPYGLPFVSSDGNFESKSLFFSFFLLTFVTY